MSHIGEIDDQFREMLHLAASFFDELTDVLHDFMGLLGGIAAGKVLGGVEILRALSSQENHGTSGNNSLAKVIVEALFWIGVLGVEFADPLMCH